MQSVRNPLSHESFQYIQDEAEVLILYINFLLNQVDKSGGRTKIDSIIELLFDDDFTDTQEYAELLLEEVPVRKRYDLLLELYQKREKLPQNRLHNFLMVLYASLTKAAKSDFVRVVSSSLMRCKDDRELRMYFHYFMEDTYSEIDRLAQLRVEDLVYKSIDQGEYEEVYNSKSREVERRCNKKGALSTWVNEKLGLLSNREKIECLLFSKLNGGYEEQKFVFKYFKKAIDKKIAEFSEIEISIIKSELKKGNELFAAWMWEYLEFAKDDEYIKLFGEEYKECKLKMDELPFK